MQILWQAPNTNCGHMWDMRPVFVSHTHTTVVELTILNANMPSLMWLIYNISYGMLPFWISYESKELPILSMFSYYQDNRNFLSLANFHESTVLVTHCFLSTLCVFAQSFYMFNPCQRNKRSTNKRIISNLCITHDLGLLILMMI
jgi:hypothetical protein